jgi:hypothetical protein
MKYKSILKYIINSLYLFCVLTIVGSCATNQKTATWGDKNLRTQGAIRSNHFIGISQNLDRFDRAFQNAMFMAHSQIINSLGVTVNVNFAEVYRDYEGTSFNRVDHLIDSRIRITGEHNIQTTVSRIFTERHNQKGKVLYNVWVELYFDTEAFFAERETFWQDEIAKLAFSTPKSQFYLNFDRVVYLKNNQFSEDRQYLSAKTINDFERLIDKYTSFFYNLVGNISIENVASGGKFSSQFIFSFTDKNMFSAIPDLPIKINETKLTTDSAGKIRYTASNSTEIVIKIGHILDSLLPPTTVVLYRDDSFSPLQNKNVTIHINSSDRTIENTFRQLLSDAGFSTSGASDVIVNITPSVNNRQVGIDSWITELKLTLVISRSGFTPKTIYIPTNRNASINGHGRTRNAAHQSAASLEYFQEKRQMIEMIQSAVRELLVSSE